jgi:hypothetical protein
MFGIKRIPDTTGHKYESRRGWFYIGWGTKLYNFHLGLGRVTFCIESKYASKGK